jgi:hypothetical protein
VARGLRAALDRLSLPLVALAVEFCERSGWSAFGHARLEDYARERLGRSGRWLRDLAALGRSACTLPGLAEALTGEDGGVPLRRTAALLVARSATAETLPLWLERARRLTVRELRQEAAAARGEGPAIEREESSGQAQSELAAGEEPHLVVLPAPEPIVAAFDEGVELHRAVCGREETVTSFVEALAAEAAAGPHPPLDGPERFDSTLGPLSRPLDRNGLETALARSTRRWEKLTGGDAGLAWMGEGGPESAPRSALPNMEVGGVGIPQPILDEARDVFVSLSGAVDGSMDGTTEDLDRRLVELSGLEERIERLLGRLLLIMGRDGAWFRLHFAGAGHYAEERLGLGRSTGESRVRLAGALDRYADLRAAYEEGRIGFEAALTVVRILDRRAAGSDLQGEWIRRAEEATVKRLRDEARALAWTAAEGRAAEGRTAEIRAAEGRAAGPTRPNGAGGVPSPLDDEAWHASLRRAPGRSRARIARLGELAVGLRDADRDLRLRLPAQVASDLLSAVELARLRLEHQAIDEVRKHEQQPYGASHPQALASPALTFSTAPWSGHAPGLGHASARPIPASWRAALDAVRRGRPVPAWVGLLSLLEDFAAVWDDPHAMPKGRRRRIYVRDGWRCMAPGCTSRANLEEHHVVYRSRGGTHETENRLCLCRFHHQRGEHGGLATCRGRAPLGLVWSLGRDGVGGVYRNERRLRRPGPEDL